MTLLTIASAASNYAGVAAPTAIVGNTNDVDALRLLAIANRAGNQLANRSPNWVSMNREYDFSTVSYGPSDGLVGNILGQAVVTIPSAPGTGIAVYGWIVQGTNLPMNAVIVEIQAGGGGISYKLNLPASDDTIVAGSFTFSKTDYSLPSDYARPVDNTMWDRTRYWAMRGSQSPQEWQFWRSSVFGKSTVERRYRFRNSDWLSSATGTPSINVFSIDPVPVDDGADLVFEYISTGWCANATTGARQSQYLADTDISVISEYLMTLSVTWRLLRRLGLSYNEELDEYEREVDKAVARDGGTMTLNLTPNGAYPLLTPANSVQEGNFPA